MADVRQEEETMCKDENRMIKHCHSLYLLFVVSSIILHGCGTPTLLETPEITEGFSVRAKLSVSLVKEVDNGFSGEPWVIPQWAFTVHPVWNSGSQREIGVNFGIAARQRQPKWRARWIFLPVIEPTFKFKLGDSTSVIGVLPLIPPIPIPMGIRTYFARSYRTDSTAFYGSLFLDMKLASASDVDIGNGGPPPRSSTGLGMLVGISAFEDTNRNILGEIGLGMYRAKYGSAWKSGVTETRPHPFVGVGMGFCGF